MPDFSKTTIANLSLHRVGNKARGEDMFISQKQIPLDPETEKLLIRYFTKSFQEATENYRFVHPVDMDYNVINGIADEILIDEGDFHEASIKILKHLFAQSKHPHIKSGDLFVVLLENVMTDNSVIKALGIFKSERKDSFIKLNEGSKDITIDREKGINIKRIDKGCLILDTNEYYTVLSLDNNSYDTTYWKDNFLAIDFLDDENFQTKTYMEMCKDFAEDVVNTNFGRKEQAEFLNNTVKYFNDNEYLDNDNFKEVVIGEGYGSQFNNFKESYEAHNEIEMPNNFKVAPTVVKHQKRGIKNLIKLDTNIHIKLNFDTADGEESFIEKGFDEDKNMNFYKVYFNEEIE